VLESGELSSVFGVDIVDGDPHIEQTRTKVASGPSRKVRRKSTARKKQARRSGKKSANKKSEKKGSVKKAKSRKASRKKAGREKTSAKGRS